MADDFIANGVLAANEQRRRRSLDAFAAQFPPLGATPGMSPEGDHPVAAGPHVPPKPDVTEGKPYAERKANDDSGPLSALSQKLAPYGQKFDDALSGGINAAQQTVFPVAGETDEQPASSMLQEFAKGYLNPLPLPSMSQGEQNFVTAVGAAPLVAPLAGVLKSTRSLSKLSKDLVQTGKGKPSRAPSANQSSTAPLQAGEKLPGFTPNPIPSAGFTLPDVARDVATAISRSGGEKVVFSPTQGPLANQPLYSVPLPELSTTIPGAATHADVEAFLAQHEAVFSQHPDLAVVAQNTGESTTLGVSATVADMGKARQLAYMHGEPTVLDLRTGQGITLPPPLELEHYSKPGTTLESGEISPSKMFTGQGGAEQRRAMNYGDDFVERSFFYKKGTKPEDRFKGLPKYTVSVDPARVYDLSADPLKFNQSIRDFTLREKAIKEAGYLGYAHPDAYPGDKTMSRVVQLFENVRPKETGLPELDRRLAFLEETNTPDLGGATLAEDGEALDPDLNGVASYPSRTPAEASPAVLNVGLHVNGKLELDLEDVKDALADLGIPIQRSLVQASNTEPTAVLELQRALTPEEAHQLSTVLRQDAIAQKTADGIGELYGPKADAWKPFNPEYFLDLPAPEKIGPRAKGVRNNVLVNAGAAIIHRGAKTLEAFKQGLETTGVVHAAGAEVNWDKLYTQAQKTYDSYVKALAKRHNVIEPIRDLTERFKRGEYLRTWYNDARDAAADAVGVNLDPGTGLPDNLLFLKFVAATSPQQAVIPNIKLAIQAFSDYKLGRPWDSTLKFNEVNLNRIVEGKPFTYDEGGIKVTDFYDALIGNPHSTTVDSHMMGAYGFFSRLASKPYVKGYKLQHGERWVTDPKGKRVGVEKVVPEGYTPEKGETVLQVYQASPKQIGFIKALMEQEAARFGVAPREYQAAVWVGQKFKIGLQPGEPFPTTFGEILREIAEKDPYFKYPDGLDEAGKASFASMWMLTRMAAGALFGGEYGDTTEARLRNAAVGAGMGFLVGHPKVMSTLVDVFKKSEAAIVAERETTRAQTVMKLGAVGNTVQIPVGEKLLDVDFARLSDPEDLKATVDRIVAEQRKAAPADAAGLREGSRGVIPNAVAKELGDALGVTPDVVMARLTGSAHPVEEAAAYTKVVNAAYDHLVQAAHELQRDASPANNATLLTAAKTYEHVYNQFLGLGEETGRTLQFLGSPDATLAKAQAAATANVRELMLTTPQIPTEHLAKLLTQIDAGTFAAVSRQASTLGTDIFNEILYFNLLSNPTTHVVNVFGSSVLAPAVSVATRATAALTKHLHPAMSADDMLKNPLNAPVTMGEVKASIVGYLNGVAMARKAIVDSWKTAGDGGKGFLDKIDSLRDVANPTGAGSKIDTSQTKGITAQHLGVQQPLLAATVDGMGTLIRSTSTALKLGDLMSSNVNYSMEVYALAYRKTLAKGLEGNAFDAEFARQLANPDKDVVEGAKNFAAIQTFTNTLDGRLASMQNMLSHPLTKIIAPFVSTPTNIFRYNLSYLPGLNFALKSVREDFQAGGARRDIVMAKMALGTSLLTGLFALAADDRITGAGPAEKSQREVWLKTHQPNSVKIGGNWYGLNRFDPIVGSWVGMSADFYGMMEDLPEATVGEMGVALTAAFFKNMTSKTWSESAFEFLDLIHIGRGENAEDIQRSFDAYVRSHAKLLIPGTQGLGAVNQAFFDDTIREVASYRDALAAQVPGWSKTLKPKLDYFGDPVQKNNIGPDLLSPINVKTGKPDPVVAEIRKQRVVLPTIPKTIDGHPLTSDELHDFKKAFAKDAKIDGKNLHQFLEAMITDKRSMYWELPEDAGPNPLSHRSEFLKGIVGQFMDEAKQRMAEQYENPKFLRQAQEIKKAKARGEYSAERDTDITSSLREQRRARQLEMRTP